jgi:2,6-dihydroxypseudooxynicotine hydrolase
MDINTNDARVKSAITHWAPRFVSNGVALTDFEEVTAQIQVWDQWCRAWSARASIHESMGREALARKQHVSAGEHLQRADVYYHFAKFLFVHDLTQMHIAHMKAVECRTLALPHLRPAGERVEIPYQGKETDAYEQPCLAGGMATLAVDGPGQGEGEYDFAIRGDYEVAVKAVIDVVETRNDVDASRLGIWGVSLGGYSAPRAAACEPRIKACLELARP